MGANKWTMRWKYIAVLRVRVQIYLPEPGGGGVSISTNNGSSWSPVNNGLTSMIVIALVFSGTNLFAGTI